MPPFRDDQILIIAPGSQTTLAQLGLPESYTPARFRLRSRMFNAEKEGEFEPVKIRRRDENAPAQQNGNGANGEAEENDGWEEDHISEEGAVWPMKQGRIVNWPAFYALMTHVFNTVNPPFHTPVLLISEPVWTPKDLERVTQFFFERFKVPAFAVMDAAMAAAYAYGVPTATVVDVGLEKANITCVSDFVLQHIGRSLAVSDCGGEALTDRLVEVMKGRKGFGRDVCDQLKRSGICEILPSDAEILKPGAGTEDASANPAAAASTGIDGSNKPAGSGAAGDVPRGPGPGTEVGEQKLEDEDGVLDIASIVTGGNMQEYLAQKEREKAEKAAAKQKKGTEAQSTTAPKPVRQQPNSKRLRNTFMYEDINLHNAMKKAGMSGQNMSDMHSALGEGPNKRQKTPEPGSAVSEAPADGGLEAAQENSSGSIFRREIEVGPERFQAASGGILDRLADAVYRTVQSCNDINRRSDLWDNMIILGNGSKVRGFKDALLARLSEKYIISPSSATIFTSELPSNLSTPIATGANTPMPQMPGQPHPSSSVNPLLVAATTAQNPHFNPAQSAFGHQSSHSHSGHGQTPTSIKFVKFPEYFPEWKEVGYDEAAFLGAQVAAKVLYVTDSANNGYMSRTTYNDQGPSGIHEVAFNHVPTHHGRQKACCAKLDGAKKKPQPSSPATDQVSSDLVTQPTRLDTLHRAVLDTTELLECILSHLPMKQIFGVQRVSRLWKDAVARSPIIQEKLFLKLKSKPTELWALLEHARRAQFKGRELRLEKLTSESDVESVSATDATMFAPVALNPFLQLGHDPDEGPMCDKPVYDRARYHTPETTEFCEGLAFGLGSSLMDTHISDLPCMRARIGKPLTLGDVIAQTWTDDKWINKMTSTKIHDDSGWSNQDERVNMVPEHEYDENDEILELDLLAGIIEQLEIKHECKVVFKPEHTVIYLADDSETDTGPFPLVPTESERRDVIDHDKDAYAALMLAIDADKKEWEAESKKSRQPMSQELLKTLFLQLQQAREG